MTSRVKLETSETSSEPKVVLKSSDMEQSKLEQTFQIAKEAISRFKVEKDVAAFIKKELDKNFGEYWHCVVGKSFGSYVTHVSGAFAYFYVDQLAVMVFKA
ncbi:Dynein light chain 1, cytoplasmic [Galdieria sulphuraria]|uniref:Dynein light chain n=1 Tax=Galdieria sulphuraria TaxID=130081 RepID=M2W5M1_GALSU|nr:dynein light chain LC8-type [Galdieria sulphuraria]EME31081.1 dynein light chain LC8-type [Galdieria sulphuraria]GJD12450.1 Dynein light chain 1, cytoplasmic [Galdieria sulphuraria]|eukprot:XP_005707601.1 dynein light chain LC8-type [Galdieria sulphuraria]